MSNDGTGDEKDLEHKSSTSTIVVTDEWVATEPVDTPALFEVQKMQLGEHRKFFANEEQFELFCMLPVTKAQRQSLLATLLNSKPKIE